MTYFFFDATDELFEAAGCLSCGPAPAAGEPQGPASGQGRQAGHCTAGAAVACAAQWSALARQRVSSGSALGSVDRRRHPKAIRTATYYRRVIRSIWKNQRDMYPAGGPKMLKDV